MKYEILPMTSVEGARGFCVFWGFIVILTKRKREGLLGKWKVNNVKWNVHLINTPCLYQAVHKFKECGVSLQNENDVFIVNWLRINGECLQLQYKISLKQNRW